MCQYQRNYDGIPGYESISIDEAIIIALTSNQADEYREDIADIIEDEPNSSMEECLNYSLQNGRTQFIHPKYGFLCVEKETYPGKYFLIRT